MSDKVNPHFKIPFKLTTRGAPTVEQDSFDNVFQCVQAIVSTPRGFRLELPDFGINDPLFTEDGPDTSDITRAIDQWEPRAETVLELVHDDDVDALAWRIRIGVEGADS
jgi:phage baseplate assembly protein W